MKSWHIVLIGIFVVIVVGMIIRFLAAKKLAELAVKTAGNINAENEVMLQTGIRRLYSK